MSPPRASTDVSRSGAVLVVGNAVTLASIWVYNFFIINITRIIYIKTNFTIPSSMVTYNSISTINSYYVIISFYRKFIYRYFSRKTIYDIRIFLISTFSIYISYISYTIYKNSCS